MNRLLVTTLVPIVALVFGTVALGAEIEDGTAVFLLLKPIDSLADRRRQADRGCWPVGRARGHGLVHRGGHPRARRHRSRRRGGGGHRHGDQCHRLHDGLLRR